MTMRHAARVGDPVTHHEEWQTNLLAIGAALLGGAIVLFSAPVSVPALVGALGVAANAGGTGLIVGELFRSSRARSVWGNIVSGASSVSVGNAPRLAAKASPASRVDCHTSYVAEGSDSVVIEGSPAARVGDRTRCAGVIAEGCPTVVFGGTPVGDVGSEAHGTTYSILGPLFSLGGPAASITRATLLQHLAGKPVNVRDALIASAELLGGFLSSIGEPAVGRPIGSAANTTSLTRRWLKYHREGGGSAALREAIIRTPGTPARMYGAIRALLW